jgi:hypothetical protein
MTDYADESKFFSPGGVLLGSESIRKFYGGTDTFIVKNGKIVTQTFVGKMSPKN